MSSQVNSYFFNNSFGAPDSPNVSLIPTFFTIVGQDSPTTSLTAEPNPPIMLCSSTVTIAFVSLLILILNLCL